MISLVGYTGFVGSNLAIANKFDNYYNSKNVHTAYGTNPDVLIYAGVRGTKFLANRFPKNDYNHIMGAIQNINNIHPKKLILISTVDVYSANNYGNEDVELKEDGLTEYGRNRLLLENWVKENIEDYIIVRLPGIYGENIKKNFIYDLIYYIPPLLSEEKYNVFSKEYDVIAKNYELNEVGFYKWNCNMIFYDELVNTFHELGISANSYTDSRSSYQFYNLCYLWKDINIAIENDIKILNIATEPIRADELYEYIDGKSFVNKLSNKVANYSITSKYDKIFGGDRGYMHSKKEILSDIKSFVVLHRNNLRGD